MWPWEHLAIGYLAVSLWSRLFEGRQPDSAEAAAVLAGSQFPDLVDKPLAWGLGALPSGTSLAHSLLVAVPLVAAVVVVAGRRGRSGLGVAFAIGYLLHPPADAAYTLLLYGRLDAAFLLWPLLPVSQPPDATLLGRTGELVVTFLRVLGTPAGRRYLALEALLLGGTALVWLSDGRPGPDLLLARLRR